MLGDDYSDVSEGEWIAVPNESEKVKLAISFGNACTTLGCTVGDEILIYIGR